MNSLFTIYHSPFRCAQLIVSITLVVSAHLHAAPPNYDDYIRPIFEQSCINCHNPDKQKGDLDLSTYSAAMRGGSGGKFAEPGDGASSKLYGVITHTLKPKMPKKGDKMAKNETDLIRAWIDGGMLENKTGKPKKKSKPSFSLKVTPSAGKPDGPPPMPKHLLLEPVVTPSRATVVTDMAASPWSPLLAVVGQRQVLLYHTDTLELVAVLPFEFGQPEVLSFHPSGKYLLAGGGIAGKSGTTVTWEIETGKIILRAGKDYDSVLAASLRADLGGVSLGGPGKRVKLWDTGADEQLISIKKHTDWVTQLAYSPDGVLLASGGRGGGVYVWEGDTGNEFHHLRAHKSGITGLAWRSDSNLLATSSEDGNVVIWPMSSGKQAKKWQAHEGGVLAIDWARSGQIVTSGRDKKVKIWESNFSLAKDLPAFSSLVVVVAFSHDGKRLFCADWSGAITVWDVASAKQIGTLAANPPSVAQQIETIQEELTSLPAKISVADEVLKKAEASYVTMKATVKKHENDHRNNVAKQKKLMAERGKLDARLKELSAEEEPLTWERKKKQQAVNKARETLNQYNAALASSRRECQQVDIETKQLTATVKQWVKADQEARQRAEDNSEDAAIQQAAIQAQKNLKNHRNQLAEKRLLLEQQKTALARLIDQQKGPGNQLATQDKLWKEFDVKWQTYHKQRKTTQQKRNGINKPLDDVGKRIVKLDTEIKKARSELSQSEQARKLLRSRRGGLSQQIAIQQNRLKSWQAAAINTHALRLKKEAEALSNQQSEAMDNFTRLAVAIGKLKEPSRLAKESNALASLRRSIDQAAPRLFAKQDEARKCKDEYLNALK